MYSLNVCYIFLYALVYLQQQQLLFVPYTNLCDTKKILDEIWKEYRLPIITIEG